MEVVRAADVGMFDRRSVHGLSRRAAIEVVLEDGGDRGIRPGADLQGPLARRFQPFGAMGLGQAQDADTGAEAPGSCPGQALFGVRPVAHDDVDQGLGIETYRRGPASDARRCPIGVTAMRAGHVFGNAPASFRVPLGSPGSVGFDDLLSSFLRHPGFLSHLRSSMATMNQKSSLIQYPQAVS